MMHNKFFSGLAFIGLIGVQLFAPSLVFAGVTIPAPTSYVVDTANMFDDELSIAADLSKLAENTLYEVAVVTIPQLDEGETIETTATAIFNDWGIGAEKEDTGLLLLISRDDREFRIETGYGVEGIITDLEAKWYLDDLIPYFKEGDYDDGVRTVLSEIILELTNDPTYAGLTSTSSSSTGGGGNFFDWIFELIFVYGGFFLIATGFTGALGYMAKDKSVWAGTLGGAALGGLAMAFMNMSLIVIGIGAAIGALIDWLVSNDMGGGSGGSSGGSSYRSSSRPSSYSSSSSSSRSFGGFSGGSSGGGGASGTW